MEGGEGGEGQEGAPGKILVHFLKKDKPGK